MSDLIILESDQSSVQALILEQCAKWQCAEQCSGQLLIHYPFTCYWLEHQPTETLSAYVGWQRRESSASICFTVTNQSDSLVHALTSAEGRAVDFSVICDRLALPCFDLSQPLQLTSVNIKKPWGQEIWFTGIEQRGVSAVCQNGYQLPLPWVLSVFPEALCAGRHQSLILLKILDPLPQRVTGDLYFELHEQKREVYVVTAVDDTAWPNGEGEIRLGLSQHKREQFANDEQFREAFLQAVKRYEVVRREIDTLLDQQEQASLVCGAGDVNGDGARSNRHELLPNTQEASAGDVSILISDSLHSKEWQLRQEMESFTDKRVLKVGDVVKVPCLTPHSLQHGVRTVEFQTPVYERLILSFAQKVLTQSHWDTERAVQLMTLDSEDSDQIDCVIEQDGVRVERIVDFDDFDVLRVSLTHSASWFVDSPSLYCLCMGVSGRFALGSAVVEPEQAMLVPGSWSGAPVKNLSGGSVCFLLANPK